MTVGVCVCVLLAALCTSCLGLPLASRPATGDRRAVLASAAASEALRKTPSLFEPRVRHSRSAPQMNADQGDLRANLNQLLARLISSRKGSVRRDSAASTRSGGGGLSAHRIKDRDYVGWLDFGRRSAEEYEYSS
ncbi:hypothetical protein CRUP_035161 [Coryphaenoides rupestris]|nr:hypothetical protein CRUP_035161 [Coryphaenoides rupestris]